MLEEYGIEIEADFHEFYRLDLLDLYRGIHSPAKVYRLLFALPTESRFYRVVTNGRTEWSTTEHLLAAAVDTLQNANWQRGGGKGSRPKPLERPGSDRTQEKRYGTTDRSQGQIRKYLADLKAGKLQKG